ncbi:MAG: 16S rRNA (adenine(1518)-N(6)/adenine(1519)-N(6))-dimethyltransferase RsmA [Candidatus Micrarchaeia archaeon]
MTFFPKKKLGQNFLVNTRIAIVEAAHASGKNVLEIGPGHGILTNELCKKAKRVIAVEKDSRLYDELSSLPKKKNLELIRGDFFDVEKGLDLSKIDIVISNIPYNLSSKIIEWLAYSKKEAILCMQREFVEHMLAHKGSKKYSRLSVYAQLSFSMTKIIDVKKGNFRPIPRVDSAIIYLKPKVDGPNYEELKIIGFLMQHKKKELKNAVIDSQKQLGISRGEAQKKGNELDKANERVFKLSPEEILEEARQIAKLIKKNS